jgi:hypothetical protein
MSLQRNREQQKRVRDLNKLLALIESKIKTTMIGAISDVEKALPEIIGSETFNRIRQEILDRGNDQIRIIKSELANYNIEFLGYTFKVIEDNNEKRS